MKLVGIVGITIRDVRCQKGDSAFLVDDGKTSILYDTGFGFTGDQIAANIKACLGNRTLDYIFLTHSHYDHALGCYCVLRQYPTAKVVAGRYAADVFRREGAMKTMKMLDSRYAESCGITDYEFPTEPLKVDIPVDDGDMIYAGDMHFRVIALPGHTRCCVGFYCEAEGLLLSCETLGVYDGEERIVPVFLVSFSDTITSIEKIEKLPVSSVLAPHYGLLNHVQTEFYLKNMKPAVFDTAEEILNSLKKGFSEEEILTRYIEKIHWGYIGEIYPKDAARLNASIMIRLIKKELLCNKGE